MKPSSSFVGITSEGGLLPTDFLSELLAPKSAIEGLTPQSYSLTEGERVSEQVNRSWVRLKGRWADFKKAIGGKQPGDPTTTETRDRWLHPIFQELGFGQRLAVAPPIEVDGRSYPVSHGWTHVPIHLVGSHVDLDRRTPGAVGAAKASPHSLVQQALNASQRHLWGIVTNGLTFRLLRDSIALTRLSYVEWDLAAIFDGDLYSEFFLLWLVCHQSRFEGERAEQCWLEKWKKSAEDKGLRALQELRPGVARAIEALGAGLVSHPANKALCARLRSGELSTQDFYRQVLRVIYRMLFLFVAEDRDLLHPPLPDATASKEDVEQAHRARRRYRDYYAITRLRGLPLHRAGTPHPDLWFIFQLLTQKLGSDTGCPELALPALGSFLWDAARSTPDLADTLVTNRHLLTAVHALAFVQDGSVRRPIDYKNLGSEELGSVYEGLLELHPLINADAGVFELNIAAGNERKTSGSYYTPDSLVQCLLDSALEPVMAEAVRGKQGQAAAEALLKLKVCDPAVGSGHFLIGAAHRVAKRVAAARSGEEEPSPEATRTALRDVIGRCLYGVDINPMSAELCRVNLWLEALEPGKPLSFLDHHIRVGNSLLGTTPELIRGGIPEAAYDPIEGDDKAACTALKKQNKRENPKLGEMFIADEAVIRDKLFKAAAAVGNISDARPEDIHRKEAAFQAAQSNYDFQKAKDLADLWCAAFVIKKHFPNPSPPAGTLSASNGERDGVRCRTESSPAEVQTGLFGGTEETPKAKGRKPSTFNTRISTLPWGITTQHLRDFAAGGALPDGLLAEAKRLADQYRFFHFHLVFPEVFAQGGFDVMFGNPPWERVKLQEQEWFAERRPDIADAPNATARKRLIDQLAREDPALRTAFDEAVRLAEGESHVLRGSGLYPLCGRGDVNLYAAFAEAMRERCSNAGAVGVVIPTALVTDTTTQHFFRAILDKRELASLLDFSNAKGLFPSVRGHQQFALMTLRGQHMPTVEPQFGFFFTEVAELQEPGRIFSLSPDDVLLVNPNTSTAPVFRTRKDAELMRQLYSRVLVLIRDSNPTQNPWGVHFQTLFHMSGDSSLFKTVQDFGTTDGEGSPVPTSYLPLFDAKMAQQYNHRAAELGHSGHQFRKISKEQSTVEELSDPNYQPSPLYYVPRDEVSARANRWKRQWLLGFKDITGTTSVRLAAFAIIPRYGVGHPFPLVMADGDATAHAMLLGMLNSLAIEYVLRQKLQGLHLTYYYLKQLPVLPPATYAEACAWAGGAGETLRDWLLPRVLELTYTAWDLEAFAQDCGWSGPPFRWDEERRFLLRCELDAAFFHLYLGPEEEWRKQPAALTQAFATPRDAVSYIMDTFPIVKRKDEAKFNGDYRTKRTILEIYDALAASMQTGKAYQARLNPAPASLTAAHAWGWEGKPLELPTTPRTPLPESWQYVVNVMVELLWQAGGSLTWPNLRGATDLLSNRDRLARLAELHVGQAAIDWLAVHGDSFDSQHRWDQLSGFCHAGKMRVVRRSGELVIELMSVEGHVLFPHVRFDARLALTVVRTQPPKTTTPAETAEEIRVAELIPA